MVTVPEELCPTLREDIPAPMERRGTKSKERIRKVTLADIRTNNAIIFRVEEAATEMAAEGFREVIRKVDSRRMEVLRITKERDRNLSPRKQRRWRLLLPMLRLE